MPLPQNCSLLQRLKASRSHLNVMGCHGHGNAAKTLPNSGTLRLTSAMIRQHRVPYYSTLQAGESVGHTAATGSSQVHCSARAIKFINFPSPLQTQPQRQASPFTSQCPWDGRSRCHSLRTWSPCSRTRLPHQLQGRKSRSLHRRRSHRRRNCHRQARSRSRWSWHQGPSQSQWMRRTSHQSLRNDGPHGSRWSRSCQGIRSSCCGSTSAASEASACGTSGQGLGDERGLASALSCASLLTFRTGSHDFGSVHPFTPGHLA